MKLTREKILKEPTYEEIELMKGGYCEGCKGVLFIHETGCYEKCSGFINKLKNIRKEVL